MTASITAFFFTAQSPSISPSQRTAPWGTFELSLWISQKGSLIFPNGSVHFFSERESADPFGNVYRSLVAVTFFLRNAPLPVCALNRVPFPSIPFFHPRQLSLAIFSCWEAYYSFSFAALACSIYFTCIFLFPGFDQFLSAGKSPEMFSFVFLWPTLFRSHVRHSFPCNTFSIVTFLLRKVSLPLGGF